MKTFSPSQEFLEDVAWSEGRERARSSEGKQPGPAARANGASPSRFPCVDGLRALAASAVLIYHVAGNSGLIQAHPALAIYVGRLGALGVAVFFAISGFLLYRPFAVAHFSGRPAPSMSGFYRRRFLRILPAYWVAFTVYALVLHLQVLHGWRSGPVFYGLLQIYDRNRVLSGLGQAWSLCTEISFYLALPLLALVAHRVVARGAGRGRGLLRAELTLVAGLAVGSVLFRSWLVWLAPPSARFAITWLPSRLDWFASGMVLAVASAWVGGGSRVVALFRVIGRRTGVCWLAAAGIFWIICHLGIPTGFQPQTADQASLSFVLYAVLACLVLMPMVFGDQDTGVVHGMLRSRPIAALGVVSYGVFLWHTIWIREAMQLGRTHPALAHLKFWPLLGIVVPVTIMSATASYHLVEKPALALKERGSVRAKWRQLRTTI